MKNGLTKSAFTTINACRVCGEAKLIEVLRMKPQYISSTLVKTNKRSQLSRLKIPMTLLLCERCGLVQLKETTQPDLLFRNYFYRSAVNKTMRNNLRDVVVGVTKKVPMQAGDVVVDIGSNDGVMLSYFPKKLQRIGVEPAKNIDWSGLPADITIVNDYFTKAKVMKVLGKKKAKIVTAIAMFYDLSHPRQVVADIKEILADDGVVCVQVSYLADTVRDANFYDVCHEHLEYYSLRSLTYLLEMEGLGVFDAEVNFANGGSLRVYATHAEAKKGESKRLQSIRRREKAYKLDMTATYVAFKQRMDYLASWLRECVQGEVDKGGLVIGLGASTKGNVVLQLCGIDKKLLPFISDRNASKVGFRTLGTDIEVISEERARNMKPSLMLVSPWYFKEEILERERAYLEVGGKLLLVMPYPHVIDKNGETKIGA